MCYAYYSIIGCKDQGKQVSDITSSLFMPIFLHVIHGTIMRTQPADTAPPQHLFAQYLC